MMKKVNRTVKKAVPVRRKPELRKHVSTQTYCSADAELVTADEPPPKYWKQLAEERQKTIDRLVDENDKLRDKMDILESENKILETLVEDASKLAEFVSSLPEDPDESGIERD